MKNIRFLFALALCTVFLVGCESVNKTWDDTWDTTNDYFKEYINQDPEIDLEDVDYSTTEEKMAKIFTPVDKPMDELSTYLNRKDRFPKDKWIEELFKRFPWINGFAVATLDGKIAYRRPETSLKPLRLDPLLADGAELSDRMLRSYADMDPLGPEIYIGTGMFKGNDVAGVLAVHFDVRTLIKFCPAPEELIIVTTEHVVWDGGNAGLAQALQSRDWVDILEDDVTGYLSEGGVEYVWVSRYVGNHQFVYLTQVAPDSDDSSFLGIF